jgi:hypothetical protein
VLNARSIVASGRFVLLIPLLLMASCTFLKNALVVNSCDTSVRVRLSGRGVPPERVEDWNVSVRVKPISESHVLDAFLDDPSNAQQTFFARVEFPGKPPELLQVPETEEPVRVAVPRSLCP